MLVGYLYLDVPKMIFYFHQSFAPIIYCHIDLLEKFIDLVTLNLNQIN
jgi:hypothetical protein